MIGTHNIMVYIGMHHNIYIYIGILQHIRSTQHKIGTR